MKIPFLKPTISPSDIQVVSRVLRSGWLYLGPEHKIFEKNFARYLDVKDAVATNSCFSSLHLSLLLAGIKPGDEVITTPLSYVATSNAIIHCGARPVFVDVDPETGLLDLRKVERAFTKRTKAILPVHLYGQMIDMKKLHTMAKRHRVLIIEDAAHAIEASRDGVRPGQLSLSACFSFHVAKNITAGQGGALITNHQNISHHARAMRRDGVVNRGPYRIMEEFGYKYLMTEFQAAMLTNQLKRIDRQYLERWKIYKRYEAAFQATGIAFPKTESGVKHASHMFVIWVPPKKREDIRQSLHKNGIETSVHYNPIHLEPFYRKKFGYRRGDFPITERLGASTITLPLYASLTKSEQEYIIKMVRQSGACV